MKEKRTGESNFTFVHEYDPSKESVYFPKGSTIVPNTPASEDGPEMVVTLLQDGKEIAKQMMAALKSIGE